MKFAVCTSSSTEIDEKYLDEAKNLLAFLVSVKGSELCWGDGANSIMGLCYEYFAAAGKKIIGYNTDKYIDDIYKMPKAVHKILPTTYDLKKNLFYDSDVIICLAGGIGTISEFFAHLEEIRSNYGKKLLVIYDENHHFDSTLNLIDDLIERKFCDKSIYDYFKVTHNVEELDRVIKNYKNNLFSGSGIKR